MRKKVIFGTVAALFLGAGILTSVNLTQKPKMSNLTLANIEAMTFDQDDQDIVTVVNGPADHRYCSSCFTTHTYCNGRPKGGKCAHTGH